MSPLLTQPSSQYSHPLNSLDSLDLPLLGPSEDASDAACLASDYGLNIDLLTAFMIRSSASTRIGCTKILAHIWIVVLARMVSGKKDDKILFVCPPNAMTYCLVGSGIILLIFFWWRLKNFVISVGMRKGWLFFRQFFCCAFAWCLSRETYVIGYPHISTCGIGSSFTSW